MSSGRLPSGSEYDDALADPQFAFRSEVLRKAEFLPKATGIGGFIHASGNFNVVARAKFEGKEWSVRLSIMDIGSTIDHYGALPSLLGRIQPFAREVRVFDAEIRVSEDSDDRFPIVATEWFDGDRLSEFVRKCCANDDRDALVALRRSLRRLSATLHQVGVSHGDVTGENILIGSGLDNELTVKLIDYDSMWSSDEPFASRLSPVGVSELQHPRQGNPIGPHADKVAFMLIDVALGLLATEPSIGTNDDLFDGRRFVFTATEVLNHASPLLERIPERDRPVVEALRGYLASDPQLPPRAWWDEQEPVGESIRSIAKAEGVRISFAASAALALLFSSVGRDEPLSDDQAVALRSQIARWRAQFNETQLVIQCGEVDTAQLDAALQAAGISSERLVRGELTPAEFTELVGLIRRVPALNGVEETVRGIADRLAVRESFVLAAFKAARGKSVGPEQAVTLDEANGTTGVATTWMRLHTEQRLIESLEIAPRLKEILDALCALAIPYSELKDGALTPDEFHRLRQQIQAARLSPMLRKELLTWGQGFRRSVVDAAWPSDVLNKVDETRLRQRLAWWMSSHSRSRLVSEFGHRGTPYQILMMLKALGMSVMDFEQGRMTPDEFKQVRKLYLELDPRTFDGSTPAGGVGSTPAGGVGSTPAGSPRKSRKIALIVCIPLIVGLLLSMLSSFDGSSGCSAEYEWLYPGWIDPYRLPPVEPRLESINKVPLAAPRDFSYRTDEDGTVWVDWHPGSRDTACYEVEYQITDWYGRTSPAALITHWPHRSVGLNPVTTRGQFVRIWLSVRGDNDVDGLGIAAEVEFSFVYLNEIAPRGLSERTSLGSP